MQKLLCPRDGVSCLTFSPDGDILAGIGRPAPDGRAAVLCWTRSLDWEITGIDHAGPITGLAFHPTGRTLAFAGISNWFWATQAPDPRPPTATPPSVLRRQFAKEKPRPFTGIHFYPLTGIDEFVPNRAFVPRDENTPTAPDNWARGLAFTPDGRFMLAAHLRPSGFLRWQTSVFHWSLTERGGVWMLANPTAERGETANGAALVGGYPVLAGEWGVTVYPVDSFVPGAAGAKVVAVSARSEWGATSDGREVTAWSVRRPQSVAGLRTAHGSVTALAFAPDGPALAIGHASGAIVFADAATGAVLAERDFGVGWVTGLAYATDGLTLAVGGLKGVVVVDAE